MDGKILLQCISKVSIFNFSTVQICVMLQVLTYHANNACVIHEVYFMMHIGITGIPMAILLLVEHRMPC